METGHLTHLRGMKIHRLLATLSRSTIRGLAPNRRPICITAGCPGTNPGFVSIIVKDIFGMNGNELDSLNLYNIIGVASSGVLRLVSAEARLHLSNGVRGAVKHTVLRRLHQLFLSVWRYLAVMRESER